MTKPRHVAAPQPPNKTLQHATRPQNQNPNGRLLDFKPKFKLESPSTAAISLQLFGRRQSVDIVNQTVVFAVVLNEHVQLRHQKRGPLLETCFKFGKTVFEESQF